MSTKNIAAVAVILCVSHFACGDASAQILTAGEKLGATGLEVRWTGQAVLNTLRDHVQYLTNDEDNIYVQSSAGVVTAFNAENGRQLWSVQVGLVDEFAMAAVSNQEIVLIVSGPIAFGINKFTGDIEFEYRFPYQPSTSPTLVDDSFFIGMINGSVYAYSIGILRHNERFGELPPGIATHHLWRFRMKEQLFFPPVAVKTDDDKRFIAFATESDNLHAVSGSGFTAGRSYFQMVLNGAVTAPMVMTRDGENATVFFTTSDDRVYSVSVPSGGLNWQYPAGRTMTQKPIVIADRVFVVTEFGGGFALDRETGRIVKTAGAGQPWELGQVNGLVAISKSHVYASDAAHRLVIVDRETANVESRVPLSRFRNRITNDLTDRLYVSSDSGEVICLREVGSEFATYHQNPEKQPIMPGVVDPSKPANADPADPDANNADNGN